MTKDAPETALVVPELEQKNAPASAIQALDIKPEGVVTAIVSVTGIRDDVDDVMEPGCYQDSLTRRRPKVIRNHDWNQQVGRTIKAEEWPPGDPRLPKETKDGKPWPAEAGALVAVMKYNLGTDRGRNAFEDIKFYAESGEAEFSIGYRVPQGAARRASSGARHVKRADLWEFSDVLFGAAPLTMALSLKDATADDPTADAPAPTDETAPGAIAPAEPAPTPAQPAPAPADQAPEAAAPLEPETPPPAEPAETPAEPAAPPAPPKPAPPEAAPPEATAPAEPAPDAPPDPERATPAETPTAETATAETALSEDELAALHLAAIAEIDWNEVAAAALATAESLRTATDTAPTPTVPDPIPDPAEPADPPETPAPTLTEMLTQAELAEGLALLAEVGAGIKRAFTKEDRDKLAKTGSAMPSGAYPIKNMADLKNAIKAIGRAKDPAAAKKHIIARAKALNLSWALPKGWQEGKDAGKDALQALESKADGGADQNRGNAEKLRHWYVEGEGAAKIRWNTPGDWQRCVNIAAKHMRPDQARGYCQLRHRDATGMYTATHAAKDRALHGKNALEVLHDAAATTVTTSANTSSAADVKLTVWTPGAEVGPLAAHLPGEGKSGGADPLSGSLEARREAVREAVNAALAGSPDAQGRHRWGKVQLLGTWTDRVVARRETWHEDGRTDLEVLEMGYGFDEAGQVRLGTPVPVDLDVEVLPAFDTAVLGQVEDLAATVKSALTAAPGLQVKEGRVLSGVNLKRLRDAVTSLLSVLAAAGVEINEPTDKQVQDERDRSRGPEVEPAIVPDTTSDGARDSMLARKSATISREELAEGLALLV